MAEVVVREGLSPGRVLSLLIGLVGAAGCVVGAALTWIEYGLEVGVSRVSVNFGGTVTASGLGYPTNGTQLGEVCLVAGLVGAIALLLAQISGLRVLAVIAVASSVAAGGAAMSFRADIDGDPHSVLDLGIEVLDLVRLGPGTIVVVLGAVALGVGALVTLVTARTEMALHGVHPAPPSLATSAAGSRSRYKVPVPDLAPNWLPDPAGRFEYRFWDGRRWTPRVARNGVEGSDPLTMASWPGAQAGH